MRTQSRLEAAYYLFPRAPLYGISRIGVMDTKRQTRKFIIIVIVNFKKRSQ
jgi:hypothetical protein